jgi:hypothetical protein
MGSTTPARVRTWAAQNVWRLLPDGIGGVLINYGYTVDAYRNASGVPTYPGEGRLARVTPQGIEYDIVASGSFEISMTAGAGRAFVTEQTAGVTTGIRAVNVQNWTTLWSVANGSLRPLRALPEGRIALLDSGTNQLIEYSATGDAGQSEVFDWHWASFSQSAFGMWTGVDHISGQLTSRISSRLLETSNTYLDPVSVGTQVGTQQYAPLPPRRHPREDMAAILMLSFLYPNTQASGVEYSGLVCREPGGASFLWHKINIGSVDDAGQLDLYPETCADGATTAAAVHTHPTQPLRDPVTQQVTMYNWPDEYPSGFQSSAVYHDVKPAEPGQTPSDLKIADRVFDGTTGVPGMPPLPDLTWYLASPTHVPTRQSTGKPDGSTTFIRYKKKPQSPAKDNLDRYSLATDTWTPIGPAPWQ